MNVITILASILLGALLGKLLPSYWVAGIFSAYIFCVFYFNRGDGGRPIQRQDVFLASLFLSMVIARRFFSVMMQ